MIVANLKFTTDLDRGVRMTMLRNALFVGDQDAHRFIVSCFRSTSRQPVDLTGAGVTGYFIRADQSTVVIDGKVEDNCAVLTLPAACYAKQGRFSLVIKTSLGDVIHTILWAEGAISQSHTGAIIDPGEVVPTLDELLAQIAAMEIATNNANTAAENANQAAADATNTANAAAESAQATAEAAATQAVEIATTKGNEALQNVDEAVARQDEVISQLTEDKNNYDEYIVGFADLIGNATYIKDYYLDDSGTPTSYLGFFYTSLIPVESLGKYNLILSGGNSTNPLRVHGYDSAGNWIAMVKKEAVGNNDADIVSISFTVPENVTQIRISTYGNKELKALLPFGHKDIITTLNEKVDRYESSEIDFSSSIDGYRETNGTVTISGNWKNVVLTDIKKGDVIKTSIFGNTNIYAILLFDVNGEFVDGAKISPTGVNTATLTASEDGTVYINFSAAYAAEGQITRSNELEQMRKDIADLQDAVKIPYMSIFHKIGGIGDSLMTGAIYDGSYAIDTPNYSWLANIARNLGVQYALYSQGGMTAKAWWNDAAGLKTKLANESEKPSLYYIALGTNDKNQTAYPVGEETDAVGADTFVGYYKAIVEYVHDNAPDALIVCVSTYNNSDASAPYNAIIEQIATQYDYCTFADYAANSPVWTTQNNKFVADSHFTTTGYVVVANVIMKITEKYVTDNLADFSQLGTKHPGI